MSRMSDMSIIITIIDDGKVRKKLFDFKNAHLVWVACMMKQDETPYPHDIRFFSAFTLMVQADLSLHPVKQFGLARLFR